MFLGHARTRGVFPGSGRFMCFLAVLPVWYYGMELIPLSSALLLLSACSMAIGKEEIPLVRLGIEEGLAGIRLLQAASSPLCPWRS